MDKKKKTVAVSGYWDPLHIGHLDLFRRAKALGDHLTVIVNSDYQASLKKGKSFMPEKERVQIIRALRDVDEVVLAVDRDRTIRETLKAVNPDIFANGGDAVEGKVPEKEICDRLGIEMIYGLGDKIQSSSNLTGLPGTFDSKKKVDMNSKGRKV